MTKVDASNREMTGNENILNSWKEIATYLGRGVRTVQRWEAELHLPVRRPRNKEKSAVIALRADLDRWLAAVPIQNKTVTLRSDPDTTKTILERRLQDLMTEVRHVKKQISQLELTGQQNGLPNREPILPEQEAMAAAHDGWAAGNKAIVNAAKVAMKRPHTHIRNTAC